MAWVGVKVRVRVGVGVGLGIGVGLGLGFVFASSVCPGVCLGLQGQALTWQSPSGALGRHRLLTLVLEYLLHHGHVRTAETLAQTAGVPVAAGSPGEAPAVDDPRLREAISRAKQQDRVCLLIREGGAAAVLAALEKETPGVLEDADLAFALRLQVYLELVRERKLDDAIAYARKGQG